MRLLCLLLFLLASCTGTPRNAYISQTERQALLSGLEQKLDDSIGAPYGKLILTYDLLGLGEPADSRHTNCQAVSPLYASLNDPQLTPEAYRARITQVEQKLEGINNEKETFQQKLYFNANKKTEFFRNMINLAQLEPGTLPSNIPALQAEGGPFISAKHKQPGNETPEADVLNNFLPVSNMEALSYSLERLYHISNVTTTFPLGNPLPEGSKTSNFSLRKDPINGRIARHEGVDLVGKEQANIYSAAAGTVVSAGRSGSYGNLVVISHGLGITTRYAHLSAIWVQEGEKVGINQIIGTQGNTGRTTGPHLHYEVRFNNQPRNPITFMELGQSCKAVS